LKNKFLWGASTSSYQVEGGITNNDWHFFTTSEKIKKRISNLTKPNLFYKGTNQVFLQPAGDACRVWDPIYYKEDFDIAKKLGMNAIKLSIEWSRVEPQRGEWNENAISHYKEMIKYVIEKGMIPIVTLNHITLPIWILTPPTEFKKRIFQFLLPSPYSDIPLSEPPSSDPYWKSFRGWENDKTIIEFSKYVSRIVQEFKNLVDYWITLSEPISLIGGGYISGIWSPGFLLDGNRSKKVLHNLIEAHVQAYNIIKEFDDADADNDGNTSIVGCSHMMINVCPAKSKKKLGKTIKDNTNAAKKFDYFVNDYFLNALTKGEEDLNYLNTLEIGNKYSKDFLIHKNWINKLDFMGLNYYRKMVVYENKIVSLSSAKFVGGAAISNLHTQRKRRIDDDTILNDLGWEIYPIGIYNMAKKINSKCTNIPLIITENGIADKNDKNRGPFIIAHLEQVRRAINDGINIIGYLHWSLLDNYEWQEEYRPEGKFGLLYIDLENSDFKRLMTNGAKIYSFIIKESLNSNEKISNFAITEARKIFGLFTIK
jgi:beta-glucosidase